MNSDFRIVSNGILFKIQKKEKNIIHIPFIIARYSWVDVGHFFCGTVGSVTTYDTLEEAKKVLIELQRYEKKKTEWTEVNL